MDRLATFAIIVLLTLLTRPASADPTPTPKALAAFNRYIASLESRLLTQQASPTLFLTAQPTPTPDISIEQLTPSGGAPLPGALLHDWRATAFAPGADAADFERLLKNFRAYPQTFAPQVLDAKLLTPPGDHLQAFMRVRQHHVLTVVLDSTYDVTFGHLDPRHGFSASRSIRISEIAAPGTPREHVLAPADEHGFLWRLNTYWTWEERDGGLYLQIESVSLSRSIPTGLGWAVRPFVESVPRESLEFTLRSALNALHK